MAHKVLDVLFKENSKKSKLKLPLMDGKFGFSLFIGGREIFIGVAINSVVIEQVIRRKVVKTIKGRTKVFNFDQTPFE